MQVDGRPELRDITGWMKKEYPYGNYTKAEHRMGLMRDWSTPLSFDVELPPNPAISFEWTVDEGIDEAEFRKLNIILTVSQADVDEQYIVSMPEPGTNPGMDWIPVSFTLDKFAPGPARITFDVDGLSIDDAMANFQIANPRIFSRERREFRRVILMGVDTLRADHLSCYGYDRLTSPTVDGLSDNGTRYSYCISTSPWTYPSFSSMFTGRYPSKCGATTNVRFLPEEETTIAEILSSEGFSTLMVTNHVWAGPPVNIHQGFDTAIRFPLERAEVGFKSAREWLQSHADEDTFVFLQFMDSHVPYHPPKPYDTIFDPGYAGRYERIFNDVEAVRNGDVTLTPDEIKHLEALYDGEIAYFDEQLNRFLEFIEEEGMDNTLIILTSDHGEEFYEHGGFEHGHTLYDELLHVPLIINGPDIPRGKTDDRLASTMDIFPTVLDYFNIPIPENIYGKSLLQPLPDDNRMLIAEQLRYGEELKGITTTEYRYIYHTVTEDEELYELAVDAGMNASVAADKRATARSFRAFISNYAVSASSPWFINFQRAGPMVVSVTYSGSITCPGGFAKVESRRMDDSDIIVSSGEEIEFSLMVEPGSEKEISFYANDDTSDISFEIFRDGGSSEPDYFYIGPMLSPVSENIFMLNIADERFNLGQPVLRRENHDGVFIWANPSRYRAQLMPELTDEMREQLQSIGYLTR